ncbi:MAG: hypothetical protein C4521_06450 [Actinobacteria bacterium]|nr:MAG: hypothetical protein C4521_06450 [Actinomycetota bacterium]
MALLACLFSPGGARAGAYSTPASGQSPHGNYADATTKCKVCHAVHNAASADDLQGGPAEALLRSQRGQPAPVGSWDIYENGAACTYCHIAGAWSIKKVYGGGLSNYRNDSRYNHDDNHRWFHARQEYRGCMTGFALTATRREEAAAPILPGWGRLSSRRGALRYCRRLAARVELCDSRSSTGK